MKNKSSTFELICLIMGSFIGAGFASGKEIQTYFSRFGFFAITLCLICGMMLFYFFNLCLLIGKKIKTRDNYFCVCFGQAGSLFKSIILVSNFIIIGSMLSGAFEIFNCYLNYYSSFVFTAILMILTLLLVTKNINFIAKINIIILPCMLIFIIIVCVGNLRNVEFNIVPYKSVFNGLISMLDYLSFNMLTIGIFLIEIGKNYSNKQIKIASLISSFLISLFIALISIMCYLMPNIFSQSMPLIYLASLINIENFMRICVFVGLFTSLISTTFVEYNYIYENSKNSLKTCFLIGVVGLLISSLGFSFIVVNLYSLMGGIGSLFLISLIVFKIRDKRQNLFKKPL